jgi:hypothetical protein
VGRFRSQLPFVAASLVALLVANLFLAWTGGRRRAQTPVDPMQSEAPPEPVGVAPSQDG